MPLFIPGKTKLTGLISSLDERYAQNSAIWSPVSDIKQVFGKMTLSSSGLVLNYGDGINSVARNASGVGTVTYTSTFDALPVVFLSIVIGSGAASSRRYVMLEDGTSYTRSTIAQSFYVLDAAATALIDDSAESAVVYIWAFGVDANTTGISDNVTSSIPSFSSLNRMIAVGDYKNPESIENTVPVISAGYTSTTVNAGDTLVNVSNMTNHTRGGAGSYTTDFDTNYLMTPMYALIQPMGDGNPAAPTAGYGFSTATAETLTVGTTNAANITAADRNYCFMSLGMMEVS